MYASVQNLALVLLLGKLQYIGSITPLPLLWLREHRAQRREGIRTMPYAAGELCLVPALTPERPDGRDCPGGRLRGLCRKAGQNDDNEATVDEIEDSGDDTTRHRGCAPAPDVDLSSHIVSLKGAPQACGKVDAF